MTNKLDKEMYIKLGEQLRKARESKNYSLEFVAERVGLTKKTIQRYETAESRISINVLYSICGVLDIDPYTLKGFFDISFNYDDSIDKYLGTEKIYVPDMSKFITVNLYSPISCGTSMFVTDNIIDIITLPDSFLNKHKDYFCQYAVGDSMINENINEGDLLVFEKTSIVENGQIGCFCIDENMATCKKFYKDEASAIITLQPANPKYAPIIVTVENMNFHVVGKLSLVINKRD